MSFSIIILAAGKGSRMNSKIPKVFHKVGNLPMIFHVLNVSASLKPKMISMVVSDELESHKKIIKKDTIILNLPHRQNKLEQQMQLDVH